MIIFTVALAIGAVLGWFLVASIDRCLDWLGDRDKVNDDD